MRLPAFAIFVLPVLLLAGCTQSQTEPPVVDSVPTQTSSTLADVLAAQPAETQARYQYRNPQATLEFVGVQPGMTVVEALPGGGWYSKILLEYLGNEGHLIGVNYAQDLWGNFPFANEEYLANMAAWPTTWPQGAQAWRGADSAGVSAFVFGNVAEERKGTVDAVLFVRALHNMARFEEKTPFLHNALVDAYDLLKPGGIVGIVQHEARVDTPDAWANGSAGYLKRSKVIAAMEQVGFEYNGASDINANGLDQPTTDDVVWRLPPSFAGSKDNPELKAAMVAVGESNRMTLKFTKPS
ncbi:MAG: putative methyltransferase [Limisphaerales bacterium]|jgi:predicted methyltransferase